MITVGIDIGSAAIKLVFVENGAMVWSQTQPSTAFSAGVGEKLFKEGLAALSLPEQNIAGIATTGYGKSLFGLSGKKVNEITANALGAHIASGGKARTIINIGGQDIKIIKIDGSGKVVDFKMNDKCAAGTGRFFEMSERILDIPLNEFSSRSMRSAAPAVINSTCAVFAETELVSLLSSGTDINDVIAGIHLSIANRIGTMSAALNMEDEIYFDGGPALNEGLHQFLMDELEREIKVFPKPQFTVAYGAALQIALEKGFKITEFSAN
ncbi:MAG: acyl-CoA dehydratase activase [Smithellaceae bacterium]